MRISSSCKTAAQRGWSIEETGQQLLEVSEKARERARCGDEGYAHVTASNAAAEQGRRRSRGETTPRGSARNLHRKRAGPRRITWLSLI